jgi:hypothetical protein
MIDTEREKEIGIGTDWPYGPIPPQGCTMSTTIAGKWGLAVGDKIQMSAKIVPLLNQIADYYNGFAEDHGLEPAVTWN